MYSKPPVINKMLRFNVEAALFTLPVKNTFYNCKVHVASTHYIFLSIIGLKDQHLP